MENLTINRRHPRAMVVASLVLNAIEPIMERLEILERGMALETGLPKPRDPRRDARDAIFSILLATGAEVITEADRIMAGLEPRNQYGLTDSEMRAIDARLTNAMFETSPTIAFPHG